MNDTSRILSFLTPKELTVYRIISSLERVDDGKVDMLLIMSDLHITELKSALEALVYFKLIQYKDADTYTDRVYTTCTPSDDRVDMILLSIPRELMQHITTSITGVYFPAAIPVMSLVSTAPYDVTEAGMDQIVRGLAMYDKVEYHDGMVSAYRR